MVLLCYIQKGKAELQQNGCRVKKKFWKNVTFTGTQYHHDPQADFALIGLSISGISGFSLLFEDYNSAVVVPWMKISIMGQV